MLWYVHPLLESVKTISFATSFEPPTEFEIPSYADPTIVSLADDFQGRVHYFNAEDLAAWKQHLAAADILLYWDMKAPPFQDKLEAMIKKAIAKKKTYRLDRINHRYEGSFYIRLSHDNNSADAQDLLASREKFMRMVETIGRHRKGYIFGTGPSLGQVMEMELSDGVSIACNSMVKNDPLLEHLQPKIITVADPIFHAGFSSYAGAFRQYLYRALDRYSSYLVVPFRDYKLYMYHLPVRFRDRLIGIPFQTSEKPNLDLTQEFTITTTQNILTLLMLPLACTLFKEVGIAGCDGRKIEDNQYFWTHHKESQINEEMEEIKKAHPSFFAIDYNDYYVEHVNTLEKWLVAGESRGITFTNLTHSYIPCLISRSVLSPVPPAILNQSSAQQNVSAMTAHASGQMFVSIAPDVKDDFGHFLHYEKALWRAFSRAGIPMISLGNKDAAPLQKELEFLVPCFTDLAIDINRVDDKQWQRQERFIQELEKAHDQLVRQLKPVMKLNYFMYLCGANALEALILFAKRHPELQLHLNMFWLWRETFPLRNRMKYWYSKLFGDVSALSNISLYTDTEDMADQIETELSFRMKTWPIFSCTRHEESDIQHLFHRSLNQPPRVVCPSNMNKSKGYDLFIELVLNQKQFVAHDCEFVLRKVVQASTDNAFRELVEKVNGKATIIEGILSSENYRRLILDADALVLPYRKQDFAFRSSAVLCDAFLFGKPVVATEGSWLGKQVQKYGIGEVFRDGDIKDMGKALDRLLDQFNKYKDAIFTVRQDWLVDHTADRLVVEFCDIPTSNQNVEYCNRTIINPTVSIIMPAFNAAKYIGEAIESVRTQSFKDWELLVVDDGSTDGTVEVVKSLTEKDSRIRLLKSEGKGVSSARNKGLDCARGEFIGFLDADDIYYPGALEARVEALKRNPDWRFAFCVTAFIDGQLRKLGVQLGTQKQITFRDVSSNPIHLNSLLGRTGAFHSIRFDSTFDSVEDWLFVAQILRRGEVFHKVDRCAVAYRIHDATVRSNFLAHANKVLKVLDWIYSPSEADFPAVPEFTKGLSEPSKQMITLRRRVGLLTWLLLAQRMDDITAVIEEVHTQDLSLLSKTDIRNQIKVTAMRFYICPLDEVQHNLWSDSASILNLLEQSGVTSLLPRYAKELQFLIDEGSKVTTKVEKDAPDNKREHALVQPLNEGVLVGPYSRTEHAYFDETGMAANLLAEMPTGSIMVDVGAHHGSSLSPFLKRGWKVFAFEPDPKNRVKLQEKFGAHPMLTIDARAVSERPIDHVPFYSSEESTGISSLSAFTDGHRQACLVSTTTITDIVREQDLSQIDFLKTDTEGYDLMVLKGVPWGEMKPKLILCEFEDRKTVPLGYTFHDLAQFLIDQGYWVLVSEWHPVIRYGIKHDWRRLVPYPCQLASPEAWGNLIAFRDAPNLGMVTTIARRLLTTASERANRGTGSIDVQKTHPGKRLPPMPVAWGNRNIQGLKARLKQALSFSTVLRRRLADFYLHWPGLVAATAVSLNAAAMAGVPFAWAFMAGGTALLLLLIGHAATRSQETAHVAPEAANKASRTAGTALESVNKTSERASTALEAATKATETASTALENANKTSGVASTALEAATKAAETAGAALATVHEAADTAGTALESAHKASEVAQQTNELVHQFQQSLDDKLERLLDEATRRFTQALTEERARNINAIKAERSARIAAFVRRDSRGEVPKRCLLQLTVPRSGSTLITDALRCHPGVYLDPRAVIYEELQLQGNRYPRGLSDGPDASIDFELAPHRGAKIPAFAAPQYITAMAPLVRDKSWAIEKIHPNFFAYDVDRFIENVGRFEQQNQSTVRFLYQVRDPKTALESYLNYQKRDPAWQTSVDHGDPFSYMERSYKTLLDTAKRRKGIIVDYSDLPTGMAEILRKIYLFLWDGDEEMVPPELIQAVVDLTARNKRLAVRKTAFFGDRPGDPFQYNRDLDEIFAAHTEAIKSCYESYYALLLLDGRGVIPKMGRL
jgi:FkbM family methyltransferase